MHGEVVEDQVVDRLERRAGDPAVVPVDARCRGSGPAPISPARTASRIQARCGAQRPFWLTARRTPFASARSQRRAPASRSTTKGFCDSTCLPARERRLDHRQPLGRVRRDVDDLDVVAGERAGDVVGRLGGGEELVAPRLGPGERAVADHRDVEARRAVGGEMRRGDAAGADQRDPRPVGPRQRRPVGQVGRGDLGGGRGLQRVGVEVGLAHGTSATVRFSRADSTALSIIRWPISAERRIERARRSARRRRSGRACTRPAPRRPGGQRRRPAPATGAGRRAGLQGDEVVVVVARDRAVACRPARSRISAAAGCVQGSVSVPQRVSNFERPRA